LDKDNKTDFTKLSQRYVLLPLLEGISTGKAGFIRKKSKRVIKKARRRTEEQEPISGG